MLSAPEWAPECVGAPHRAKLAYVYVRQSTAVQVRQHQESTELQYRLVDRAAGLGWPRERIAVIDDDLGKSGASASERSGFQRLSAAKSRDACAAAVRTCLQLGELPALAGAAKRGSTLVTDYVAREACEKSGARIVRHCRYLVFQLAEVAVPRAMFAAVLRRIDRLREPPVAAV